MPRVNKSSQQPQELLEEKGNNRCFYPTKELWVEFPTSSKKKSIFLFSEMKFTVSVYSLFCSTFAHPCDTSHHRRSPDIWGLPPRSLQGNKGGKKSIWVSGDSPACRPVTGGVQSVVSWPSSLSLFCQDFPRPSEHIQNPARFICAVFAWRNQMWVMKGSFRGPVLAFDGNERTEKNNVPVLK